MSWMDNFTGSGGGGGGGNPGYTKTTTTATIISSQSVTTEYISENGDYEAVVTQEEIESAPESITATVDSTDYEVAMTQDVGNGFFIYGDPTFTEVPFYFVLVVGGGTSAYFCEGSAGTHTIEVSATITTLVVSDDFKEAVQSLNLAVNLHADTLDKTFMEINNVYSAGGNVTVFNANTGLYERVTSTQASGGSYYVTVGSGNQLYEATSENGYPVYAGG